MAPLPTPPSTILSLLLSLLCVFVYAAPIAPSSLDNLISCLQTGGVRNYTALGSSPYLSLLDFSIQNLRYQEPQVPKPAVLIFPYTPEHVQTAVQCCVREKTWELRVRSGGHSYEALSSTGDVPFVIIDLMNMHAVADIDLHSQTAWVEAGATLGEIYYSISQKTSEYAFPAGVCPTIGSGGHFSGGGYSQLSRKHGLAADNVIDARFVDAAGNLLDRQSMGEDLFWALRGGGGGSWGIVVAWKIKLVPVPRIVTVINTAKTGVEEVVNAAYQWQTVAASAPKELYLGVYIAGLNQSGAGTSLSATFYGMYLGPLNETLAVVNSIFPDLGLNATNCVETTWIGSILRAAYLPSATALIVRFNDNKGHFKAKSDYVTTPIPKQELEGALRFLEERLNSYVIFSPYGGRMAEIPPSSIAFPHRAGNLYMIQYQIVWNNNGEDAGNIAWLQKFYEHMTPYVSHSPRAAYVNYIDLDLGTAANGTATVEEARAWGERYFAQNYDRLVQIKSRVDRYNVFRNPQSIPPQQTKGL